MKKIQLVLLASAAASSMLAGAADAQAAKKPKPQSSADGAAYRELLDEIKQLRAEVNELKGELAADKAAEAATKLQAQLTSDRVRVIQEEVAKVPAASVTKDQVDTEVALAIDREHNNDTFYYKGITLTPGGYLELANIYRNRFEGDDIASSFNIPFPAQSHQSATAEDRFSARQSRISLLAQGSVDKSTQLSMYGELDFQGAAQTSNSNQSDSFVPRTRVVYGQADWNMGDYGLHLQVGQNWSLLTLQGKGMSARAEQAPPQIDAQYIPGFVWARQPGVRLIGDFMNQKLWIGLSAENPQTTFGGTGVPATVTSTLTGQNGTSSPPPGSFQQFYNGVGSSLSLNHVPDLIGKLAWEDAIAGHNLHLEAFGIDRTFSEHFNATATAAGNNRDVNSFGYGGSVVFAVVPKMLDLQVSGISGAGIGRYGSAGLPDVTFDKEGNIHPISEVMLLAGGTWQANPMLEIYAFGGEEQEQRKLLDNDTAGLGLFTANNSNCDVESGASCAGNTRRIDQATLGFWNKFYQGSFGSARLGLQYSYTRRVLFAGIGGAPTADNNMVFLSFRYNPF